MKSKKSEINSKRVYIAVSSDVIQKGHINIISQGQKYGDVILGILSDKAISSYKRMPIFDLETRLNLFGSIKGVKEVVVQDSLDYTKNLLYFKPDYVLHGDDWTNGIQKLTRQKVIDTLKKWDGQLIEIPYTKYEESSQSIEKIVREYNSSDFRRSKLKRLLKLKKFTRVLEASNGLTGLIVENTNIVNENDGSLSEFDAMWISSLTDSTLKGKPDIELVDLTSRLKTIDEIMEVTSKPIILDGDTGGKIEHFIYTVQTLERIGVSAIIIEDKTGLKQNSLYGTDVKQTLEDPYEFGRKIKAGKDVLKTREFMIIARLESLIAGYDVHHAIERAKIYINSGADGIMIHSKEKDGKDILEFLKLFREYSDSIPVVVVPTTYNHIKEVDLANAGASIIIYANHLLRSSYKAMLETAKTILINGRSKEVDNLCISVKEVLKIIPRGKV